MSRLKISALLGSRSCRERDLVCAMIAARIIAPHTKLATTRWWHTTTLAEDFSVAGATEDELYAAMDWLLARQSRIQKKLAGADLEPACLDLRINVTDVLGSIAGFSGLDYPFTATAADPCDSTCPTVLP